MKEIYLSNNNGIALVDDEDYEMLIQYKWHNANGRAQTHIYINNKRTTKKIHNLLLKSPKGFEIDHIDGNPLNNQKNNLRIVTHQQNMMNRKIQNSSSKFKGVSWEKDSKKWRAYIRCENKQYYIGLFKTELDAAMAYNKRAIKLHNKYARLNKV